jgi:hypothetical protein
MKESFLSLFSEKLRIQEQERLYPLKTESPNVHCGARTEWHFTARVTSQENGGQVWAAVRSGGARD